MHYCILMLFIAFTQIIILHRNKDSYFATDVYLNSVNIFYRLDLYLAISKKTNTYMTGVKFSKFLKNDIYNEFNAETGPPELPPTLSQVFEHII